MCASFLNIRITASCAILALIEEIYSIYLFIYLKAVQHLYREQREDR